MYAKRATLPTAPCASCSLSEQRDLLQGMPADESTTLELCQCVIEQRDERGWEQVYQQWRSVLIHWLLQHSCARLALVQESPEYSVTAALRKFWHATTRPNRPGRRSRHWRMYTRICVVA